MKKIQNLLAAAILAALSAAVWADCPLPGGPHPDCPGAQSQGEAVWPCCWENTLCPKDSTKYARRYRHQPIGAYLGTDFQWHGCVRGPAYDGGVEPQQCCGDPVSTPAVPIMGGGD